MNYIGQEIQDFSVKAYQQGELKDVTKKTFWVNGACSSFIQPISPLCAQLN